MATKDRCLQEFPRSVHERNVLNSDLFDFYAKPLGVAPVYEMKRGKRGRMTKTSWKCADVNFENDVMGISLRERPLSTPVTGFS